MSFVVALVAMTWLTWGAPGAPAAPWRELRYSGRTEYTVLADGERTILHAVSHDQHSALVREQRVDPRGITLAWRWRVLQHPDGADPELRHRDDRAAGVIVLVRRSFLPWRTRALVYQWSPARPRGAWSTSPYSRSVKTLVLENAPADSVWREARRDLSADLERAFGEVPDRIEALGVICDTDNTGASACAEFGALSLEAAADTSAH